MKKIYYLAGLPRSGNTLLSSILNQNSKINTTPLSGVNTMIYNVIVEYKNSEKEKNFPDDKSFHNSVEPIMYNYYKDWTGDTIIQRTPVGLFNELAVINKYLKNDFKVIVLVRDFFEVLASFIKLYKEDNDYFLHKRYKTDEEKVNALINNDSLIQLSLESMYNLYYGWYDNCLFIKYNDLIKDTKKQIDKIYSFLNIESFNHTYTDDSMYGKNLHVIKTDKIEKTNSSEYKKYIPDNILKNYEFTNNWLNGI
jgi:sulfotransferase